MPPLTRPEAASRAALVNVHRMEVDLDLDQGEDTFGSRTRIRFGCADPGASTFADLKAVQVTSIELNGVPLDPATVRDGRVALDDLRADNELVVVSTMGYSRDGQGLHRAVDPADGQAYVYGHLFLDAGPRVFACFDQPDLKAAYAVTVRAPQGWTVIGNGAATETAPGEWVLAETLPLATYFVTVCAGPYASVRSEHDGIPLGVHARASLRGPLEAQADQMFEVTRQGFDYYHGLFGIRYPFGEYHQVFVPEFNAGAMENPGCVTFRDQYVFRGAATREEVTIRSSTITHEMAHMWFGDLVTMQWWDDLWLNESFAEYMASRSLAEATEFTEAWVDSTMSRKMWGYAAERAPSTHPVAGAPAQDVDTALQNFDGISYAKGSAVLRQLIAHIGDDAFIAGVSAYLRANAGGNGTLAQFLGFMEETAGRSLDTWSAAWLETAGVDVLAVDPARGEIHRTTPPEYPADRPHTFDIAGFTDGTEVFRLEATISADLTELPELVAAPDASLIVPNASDLTWATVSLGRASIESLPVQLPQVPDPQARAVVWGALTDGVFLGQVDPRSAVRTFVAAWPAEVVDSVLSRSASVLTERIIARFLPPADQPGAVLAVARVAAGVLDEAESGSSRALIAARLLARTSTDLARLRAWSQGRDLPADLVGDSDFRWVVVGRLAQLGDLDAAEIERVRSDDDTLAGRLAALTARAQIPEADAKAWAWQEITTNRDRTNYELNALSSGFWRADPQLVRDYVPRYFADVPPMRAWVGQDALARVAALAYPGAVVERATALASREALERGDLTAAVRRSMVDEDAKLGEALRSRATFG